MPLPRRNFLKLALGAAALPELIGSQTALLADSVLPAAGKKIPLCIQVYSVRDLFKKDPDATFAALKEAGYDGIEYCSNFQGIPVEKLRDLQEKYGLFCSGTHTGMANICEPEQLKKTIEDHKTVNAKFAICSWMKNDSIQAWLDAAKKFNAASEVAREAGIWIGYHAHQHDFTKTENGLSTWEIFGKNTSRDVILQNDIGHCVNFGGDPYALLEAFPGRSRSLHIRESDNKLMGEGRVDWKRIFRLAESAGGIEVYSIEFSEVTGISDPMEVARRNVEAFRKLHG